MKLTKYELIVLSSRMPIAFNRFTGNSYMLVGTIAIRIRPEVFRSLLLAKLLAKSGEAGTGFSKADLYRLTDAGRKALEEVPA